MLKSLLQQLVRRRSPVILGDLGRMRPVSTVFGLDRGTAIDRRYIEGFLRGHASAIAGQVLEVGDDHYTRAFGAGRVTAADVLHAAAGNRQSTIVGDLTDPATLPADRYDCFICTQTFNFIYDVQKAAEGARHLLKPGGMLLATMAGVCQVSRYDMDRWGDFWRFTPLSAQRLFAPLFAEVAVGSLGNVLAATALLQGVAVEDLPDPALLDETDPDYPVVVTVAARKAP